MLFASGRDLFISRPLFEKQTLVEASTTKDTARVIIDTRMFFRAIRVVDLYTVNHIWSTMKQDATTNVFSYIASVHNATADRTVIRHASLRNYIYAICTRYFTRS